MTWLFLGTVAALVIGSVALVVLVAVSWGDGDLVEDESARRWRR